MAGIDIDLKPVFFVLMLLAATVFLASPYGWSLVLCCPLPLLVLLFLIYWIPGLGSNKERETRRNTRRQGSEKIIDVKDYRVRDD